MQHTMDRRGFLRGTAWMGAAAMLVGCQLNRFGFGAGGSMQGFAYRRLMGRKIKVAFVGVGARGTAAVHRVSMIPGVDIVAICDRDPARVDANLKWLADRKYRSVPKTYIGDEAYKDLCDSRLHPRQLEERPALGHRQRRPREDGHRRRQRLQRQRRIERLRP